MSRGSASGISLSQAEVEIMLGMDGRGDRHHDIAAWFGVNQGRVAEAKAGEFGTLGVAPADKLPPKGPPGIKGRRLRASIDKVVDMLKSGKPNAAETAAAMLAGACKQYDSHEA